jgi:hypothetical protein
MLSRIALSSDAAPIPYREAYLLLSHRELFTEISAALAEECVATKIKIL